MSGRRSGEPLNNKPKDDPNEKVLHSLSLSIFSESGVEAAVALHELLRWSDPKPEELLKGTPLPQPTPCLIQSLTRLILDHVDGWAPGCSAGPAMTALSILSNLTNMSHFLAMRPMCCNPQIIINNAVLIGAVPDTVELLLRLTIHPYTPLGKLAHNVILQIAKFVDIEHTFKDEARRHKFVNTVCSLFLLADPNTDEQYVTVFLHFALLPRNCALFADEIGADLIYKKIGRLLTYPSTSLRDLILESVYAMMTNTEMKDAASTTTSFLRSVVSLAIPQAEPCESKFVCPFTPCQKACVLLLELCDDSRVLSYLANFKYQLADAMCKWKSCSLSELALKVSNVSS